MSLPASVRKLCSTQETLFVSLLCFHCWSQIMERREYKSEKCVISFGTSKVRFVNMLLRVTTANGFPVL